MNSDGKTQAVRLISWKGGFHVYAKVGDEDVVDADGNQKWSTQKEALDAAGWFISKYKDKEK